MEYEDGRRSGRLESNSKEKHLLKSIYPWSELTVTDGRTFPHHLVPGQNLHSEIRSRRDGKDQHRKPIRFKSSFHKPLLPPSQLSYEEKRCGDLVTSLVYKKLQWETNLPILERKYRKKKLNFKGLAKKAPSDCSEISMGKFEAHILSVLNEDPDPDFSGVTNWWYSGGRLSSVTIGGQTFLLTSSENNQELFPIPLTEETKHWQPSLTEIKKFKTDSSDSINQITCTSSKSGTRHLVGVRQRHLCSVSRLELADDDSLEEGNSYSIPSKDAFLSIDLNPYKFGKLCTASVDREVSLWDSKKCSLVSSCIVDKPEKTLSSKWCSVQYVDSHTVAMADSLSLFLLDTRQAYDKPCLSFCPQDSSSLLMPCEYISLIFRSSQHSVPEKSLYFATNHNLCFFDARSSRATQRWTHMMRSPPIYGHTVSSNSEESTDLIFIGNQEPTEVVMIENKWSESKLRAISEVLPFYLPILKDSVQGAQLCGTVLDPRSSARFLSSLTGVLCLPSTRFPYCTVFSQTSTGQLFSQDLSQEPGTPGYTDEDKQVLRNWEEQVCTSSSTRLILKKDYNAEDFMFENQHNVLPKYKRPRLPKQWKLSKTQILSYTDFLAPKLIKYWGFENDQEVSLTDIKMEVLEVSVDEAIPTSTLSQGISNGTSSQTKTNRKKRRLNESGF